MCNMYISSYFGFKPELRRRSALQYRATSFYFKFARPDMSDVMHVISADQTEQWEKENCL